MSSVANSLNKEIEVQDWITLNTEGHVGQSSQANTNHFAYGYIRHVSSGKYVHPFGRHCPVKGTLLELGEHPDKRYLFRFVPVTGHLGYIEHYCGMVIHPYSGNVHPVDYERLVVHPARLRQAYFYIDNYQGVIVHSGHKIFHPKEGGRHPKIGTLVVLHRDRHSSAEFQFVPARRGMSVMPPPKLTGNWKIIYAANASETQQIYSINYEIGKVLTKQATEEVYWKVLAKTAVSWFENSNLRTSACIVKPETWDEAITKKHHLKVSPGSTSVVWQWVFCAEQLDEEYCFRSPILANTDDATIKPDPLPEMYPGTC